MTILDRIRAVLPVRIEFQDLITYAGAGPNGKYLIAINVASSDEEYAVLDNVSTLQEMLPKRGYMVQINGAITSSSVITPIPDTEQHVVNIPSQGREFTVPTLECGLSHVFGIVN